MKPSQSRFSLTSRRLTAVVSLAMLSVVFWPVSGLAQAPDVLGALLTEVRGLRIAMEQMAAAGPRVQLALGRLQLQEQRVENMTRRLDQLKGEIARAQEETLATEDRLRSMAELTQTSALPAEAQRQIEAELKAAKSESGRRQVAMQALQQEEASLAQELSVEQGRWNDFNRLLEELERSLGRR